MSIRDKIIKIIGGFYKSKNMKTHPKKKNIADGIEPPRSKYWNTIVDILDGQFPKGKCKERGRALVMVAYIDMMLQGYKFDENGDVIIKKESVNNKKI